MESSPSNSHRHRGEPVRHPYHWSQDSDRHAVRLRMVLLLINVVLVLGLAIMLYLMGARRWG
jgi:hypothetical protein